MNIKTKILLYISVITILLYGAVLLFIFTLFYKFREKEFHQEQSLKIHTTLNLLTLVKKVDKPMIDYIDRLTLNDLYDENILVFDNTKKLLYTNMDHPLTDDYKKILEKLAVKNPWIQQKDELYDIIGMSVEKNGKHYYGICKAYDISGYVTMNYLKRVLIFSFFGLSFILFISLFYLSGKITKSIVFVTNQIKKYNFENNSSPIIVPNENDEIALLVKRFNDLMTRMNKAYQFQKHAAHHISHELKTPVSVLVSNFEKIERETDLNRIKELIIFQKEGTLNLSSIINSLLELAKVESGQDLLNTKIRIDEMLFDISDELSLLYPDYCFSITYEQLFEDETHFWVQGNPRLLKSALLNLMLNCIQYSNDKKAKVIIAYKDQRIEMKFINNGPSINFEEQQYLFQHFFRGENSKGKKGFGLGLVLVKKILNLHRADISYHVQEDNINLFTIKLPLIQN